MGFFNTILLILFTGIVGVFFVRQQGLEFYLKLRSSLISGKDPGEALLNGFFILLGGVLLITPGLITDLWGFFMLMEFSRNFFVYLFKKIIKEKIKKEGVKVYTHNISFDHNFDSFQNHADEEERSSHNIIDLNERKNSD